MKKSILDYRRGNSRLFNDAGEINASSKSDVLNALIEIAKSVQTEGLQVDTVHPETAAATKAKQFEEFRNAYEDTASDSWTELGNSLSSEVYQRLTRQGWMRNVLSRGEVANGAFPRISVKMPNVVAVISTGPTRAKTQFVRDKYILPEEFVIHSDVRVSLTDLYQGSSDIIDRVFVDANEAIMTAEDRQTKAQMDIAAGINNDTITFTGSLSHSVIAQLQNNVTRWGMPASKLMLAMPFISDMQSSMMLNDSFDPATKLELFTKGIVGNWFGMDLITDGLREPNLKVLELNEIFVVTEAEMLGAYTERFPVRAEPRDNEGNVPGRGWYLNELISSAIANSKGVSKARRV